MYHDQCNSLLQDENSLLPDRFNNWFQKKGWNLRPHQAELLKRSKSGQSTLLIAPTGAGKTLAGFLPSMVDLSNVEHHHLHTRHLHTLYISPLKALAQDIERNLKIPVQEMGLDIAIETRTGDTPQHKRQRQKYIPPDILLTTPEQVSLLLSSHEAEKFFGSLDTVIFDELHSLVTSKRGQLLSLALARLRTLRPDLKTIGLSATVSDPDSLRRWLVSQKQKSAMAGLVTVEGGAKPEIRILQTEEHIPWAGHSARYAVKDILDLIKAAHTTLIFVNTRSQAEMLFQELWRMNEDSLPIALHHGSLDVGQRRKVEEAMALNKLRAVVATSTLDLGIDWGDIDLVIHVGAPKGASRLAQRIGRANHRMDEPSKAVLVPANCFEVLECQAALDANYIGAQDSPHLSEGAIDVLAQHILGMACAGPFNADELYQEVKTAEPYSSLKRKTFDETLNFVATGGYALKAYEQYAKIRLTKDGRWRVSNPGIARQYRLNMGTIVEAAELNVRLVKAGNSTAMRGGRMLGRIEESFLESLTKGDTFIFAGHVLCFEAIRENECYVSLSKKPEARVPSYMGGRFPLSTYLADRLRKMLANPKEWHVLPEQVQKWLSQQKISSILPDTNQLLIETFNEKNRSFLVAYPFEGRLAHQTLGMLLTRRLERAGLKPVGFVATDYSIGLWTLDDIGEAIKAGNLSLKELFSEDMLGDDLEAWLDESYLLKRSFRNCAMIAGLINRRHPGQEKTGRQVTVSTDLIFDVLRTHEPNHILLQATRQEAARGLLDIKRLGDMLKRIKNHIIHRPIDRMSPLALPVMLEIGKEMIPGSAEDNILMEAAEELIHTVLEN
ncbi:MULTISPECIES: ligase-associated DNA damage response DEXH box helicase [Bartonella]|uniref:ligase-associated DNA damage response DEXH box helicase n=1 Tax=Bartonella TaxID=773 RepID=UPI0018DD1796|nr:MULTISPECIES: ligase-associated DNA damage response DEXH box helicase [Bartonella]MBH9974380.1 ligase-associated DNA damage response DEXH box helicase [Bartonella choladocola]MBI0013987.1 ligase-associated DNA damage response DEXH box helicase [Bartonella sp. B10834G3]MBI0139966.1 ligase-associated DNA damage response DEXH box helicase [Bartonella choladocola]